MSRSWTLMKCADCGRQRVHLRIGQAAWKCIGKLAGATRKCGR